MKSDDAKGNDMPTVKLRKLSVSSPVVEGNDPEQTGDDLEQTRDDPNPSNMVMKR